MDFDCHAITQKDKACKLKANGSLRITTIGGRKIWAAFCDQQYRIFFDDENEPNVETDAQYCVACDYRHHDAHHDYCHRCGRKLSTA